MAYRPMRGYSGGGYAEQDPLAAAIMGAIGTGSQLFDLVQGVRRQRRMDEQNERRYIDAQNEREQERIDAERRWQVQRADAKEAETRGDEREARRLKQAREEKQADYLRSRGISIVPTPGGGVTYAKVAQTDDEMTQAIQRKLEEDELRQQAEALGVPNAATLSRGALQVVVGEAMAKRKGDAEFRDFTRRENYSEGLARGRIAAEYAGRAALAGQASRGRPLPAMMADKIGVSRALLGTSEDARQKLEKAGGFDPETGTFSKSVTGWIDGLRGGRIADNLGFRVGADGVSAQAALSNLASSVMKERSGGAVTPQEFVRLEPFLPSKYDTEEKARQKIIDLQGELQRIHQERLDALEASGYDVESLRWGASAPAPAAGPKAPGTRRPLREVVDSTGRR